MSNLFSGFGRFKGGGKNGGSKSPGPPSSGSSPTTPTGMSHPSSSSTNLAPRVPPLPSSPSLSQTMSMNDGQGGSMRSASPIPDPFASYNLTGPLPYWLKDPYSRHIVKGNFMTLSTKPKTVEQGEWIAHQVVEHFRILWTFVQIIHAKESDGSSICNPQTCPRMSAGPNHSFTWLNSRREPVEVPAHEYITLMQRWISSKIENSNIFPTEPAGVSFAPNPELAAALYNSTGLNLPGSNTPNVAGPTGLSTSLSHLAGPGDWIGKSSGFPPDFAEVCSTIFRQMFRVYAHIYWAHFTDPIYHMSLERSLNSCFSHFILTATSTDMLKAHELVPMQVLMDLWCYDGTFAPESKAFTYADFEKGRKLFAMSFPNGHPEPSHPTNVRLRQNPELNRQVQNPNEFPMENGTEQSNQ